MAGLIPEDTIAEVRERTDIVQVIGQYVELKRSGANFMGLCPFHDEKSGSFSVNKQKQFYHCFGCHESGDVFSFLMKLEGRNFTEVVEDLASRANVEIKLQDVSPARAREAARRKSERQQGLDLNRKVAELYRKLLLGSGGQAARQYLKQRGISDDVAEAFRVGFAPPSGDVVVRLVQREKVPPAFAEKMGLIAKRRGRDGYHDRFWNRLIFPVARAGEEILGFGGRLLGDGAGPKYTHTPETQLYRKGEVMFGMEPATIPIRRAKTVILVEGNLDVIQMYQHGLQNTLAPMGTALTARQVLLLRRMADDVVAIFDGDDAGQAAAVKTVPMFVENEVSAKFATLPPGVDPDDFLLDRGAEAMKALVDGAAPSVDFLIDAHVSRMEDSIPGRTRVMERVVPVVARLKSQVARELYAGQLASTLGVDPGTVRRAVAMGRGPTPRELGAGAPPVEQRKLSVIEQIEVKLLAILAEHPHLVHRAEQCSVETLLTNEGLRATYRAAVEMQQESGRIVHSKLLQATPAEILDIVAKEIHSDEFAADGDPTKALDDCVARLQRGRLERELTEIRKQIVKAKQKADLETIRTLAMRQVELEREIHETR